MKRILSVVIWIVMLVGCSRNPTLRSDVRQSIQRQSSVGIVAFRRGEYEAARGFFEDALKQAYQLYLPEDIVKLYANLAEVALRLNQWDEADDLLQQGEKIASQESIRSFDLLLVRARFWQKTGQKSKAREVYESTLTAAKTSAEKILARIQYADLLIEEEKWEEARRLLDGAGLSLWFFSDYDILGLYHYYTGLVARGEKNYDKAIQAFRRALASDQKAENLEGIKKDVAQLAEVYRLQGQTERATYYEEFLRFLH